MNFIDKYDNLYVLPEHSNVTVIETKDFFKNGDFKSPFTLTDKLFGDTKAYRLPIETWRRFDESLILSEVGLFSYCKARHVVGELQRKMMVTTRYMEFQQALVEIGCNVNYDKKREMVEAFMEADQYKNYVHPPYLWNGNRRDIEVINTFFLDKAYITQKWDSEAIDAKMNELINLGYLKKEN